MIESHQPRPWIYKELPSPISEEGVRLLKQETGLSDLTLKICLHRGLHRKEQVEFYLAPRLEMLKDPFLIRDMEKAVLRITRAREKKQKILVYGDYDVDGTTATALMSWFLKDCGIEHECEQPDRFRDGYGLCVRAVNEAHERGVHLIISVDCGVTNFEAAGKAKELGLDLIIVDHHQIDPQRGIPPEAVAVVDPHRPDCSSGLKELCGCGLAFYLTRALRTRGRELGWWKEGSEPNLKQHLDLVVMATAADMVPLSGDNHILIRHGVGVLKDSIKPGVKALLQGAGLNLKEFTPSHLGYLIGPRINASGRMGSAKTALQLLCTKSISEADQLANELELRNKERTEIQNQIWDQVRVSVEQAIGKGQFQHAVVVADENWHEGVIGIVASRIAETFQRPAVVIAIREGVGKGSVRSYGSRDILSALRKVSARLKSFGGHRHAAGLSVEVSQLDGFIREFDRAVSEEAGREGAEPLMLEARCEMSDLDMKTLVEIEKLGPFGPGNPEPVVSLLAVAHSHQIIKGRHLRLLLGKSPALSAIWFNAAEDMALMKNVMNGVQAQWAGVPELNRFQGTTSPSFRIRDYKTADPS